jgi:hypothetical protein
MFVISKTHGQLMKANDSEVICKWTYFKNSGLARCQWLTPIILPTQEAEIRRMEVGSQPGQIVPETLSRKNPIQEKAG